MAVLATRLLCVQVRHRLQGLLVAGNYCTESKRPSAKTMDLSGIFPPIATPFDTDENVDYEKLRFNLQRWNDIPFKGR